MSCELRVEPFARILLQPMSQLEKAMKKTYKDLTPQEELEFVLWFGFLEDSVRIAQLQMTRWNRSKNGWDLQLFFVVVVWIDDAISELRRFLSQDDAEVWAILKRFGKEVKKHNLRGLRNDIVHPRRIFKWQDKKGHPLPESPIRMFGAYHVDRDEYFFGTHTIEVSKISDLVETMAQDLRNLFAKRLEEFYSTRELTGMIDFPSLHRFAG